MSQAPLCKHCSLPECDHHEFEREMPEGCQCAPWTWDLMIPICAAYRGSGERCLECQHDKGCHK